MKFFDIFKKKTAAACGHEARMKDRISAFGESCESKILIVDGKIEYCHRCLEKMAIKCAWCGKVIFVGMPITLYCAKEDFILPESAVWFNEELRQPIGCGQCAELGPADWMGYWVPPGRVYRVISPTEFVISSNQSVQLNPETF